MLITVKTFNGHNINDGSSYRTVLQNQHTMSNANPVFIDDANTDPRDAGVYTVDVQNKVLSIKILNYGNRYDLIAQLKTWFKRGTKANLVVTFGDDNVDYQVSARVINLVAENNSNQTWAAVLQTGSSTWRAVTESTQSTWTITGATETLSIDVGGRDETFLSIDLTPTGMPSGGYLYQNMYRLPNTPGVTHGIIPWCITVNTAALVAAGKMQADCDDLRIVDMNTGQELRRWIASPNNASTKVWINLKLEKGFSLTLAANVAGVGSVGALEFSVDDNTRAAINEMPNTGIIYHGNEWFAYSGKDSIKCSLTVSQRGLFGTTIEAHTAGVSFLYIQYPLVMKYGNSGVSAPSSTDSNYDLEKPLINLVSSSNTAWVWGGSNYFFSRSSVLNSGGWKVAQRSLGSASNVRDLTAESPFTDTALGFMVQNYLSGGQYRAEDVEFTGTFYRAAEITGVVATGQKVRSNANWLETAALRSSLDGILYNTLFAEDSPTAIAFENWDNNGISQSPAAGSKFVQLIFQGSWPAANKQWAVFEMLTCAASFNSSYIPTGAFLGEHDGFPLGLTIENETTGDIITLSHTILLNKLFIINGETNQVQYDGYNAFGSITLDDESRPVYIRLVGDATNTIRISGVSGSDLGTISADLHWFTRRF